MNKIVKPDQIGMLTTVIPPMAFAGGGGGFGKGASGGATESPDNLRSKQVARIVDLLGEGPNVGIVGWTKGIYFDGVVLQNADGTFNFSNAIMQQVLGEAAQPVMQGHSVNERPGAGGGHPTYVTPIVRDVLNTDTDRVRIIFSVPSLQSIDDEGNISGTSVQFAIDIQNNGGGYLNRGTYTITGKTSSGYQREIVLDLPRPGPWNIRIRRLTKDSTSQKLQNDLNVDGIFELTDEKVNFTLSHCVGIIIDAEQFSSIPARTYLVDGRKLNIPASYDPVTRTYDPAGWDGVTWKNEFTNNPVWVLYDMITHKRYGLGRFIDPDDVDVWSLYTISQWCDKRVPTGKPDGSTEPRFVCNAVINDQQDAFDLLNQICAIFRGFIYWSGGQLVTVADRPTDISTMTTVASGIFSPANVIDGVFNYMGADIKARHNQVKARWYNGANMGQERWSVVEDADAISRYGILDTNIEVLGASTESQALRAAKWQIYTETYEAEVVQFSVGLSGAWVKPGDIIAVADPTIGGSRRGGRIYSATSSRLTFDSTTPVDLSKAPRVSVVSGEQTDPNTGEVLGPRVVTMNVTGSSVADGRTSVTVFGSFNPVPAPNTPWVLSTSDLATSLWRIVSVSEGSNDDAYTVSAIAFNETKWNYIERNLPLLIRDTSNIEITPPAVKSLKVDEALVAMSINSVAVKALLSWTGNQPYYDINARARNGNWQRWRSVASAFEVDVTEGWWDFQVTAVNLLGRKSPVVTVSREIIGRNAPPKKVNNFRGVINSASGLIQFRWDPAPEIDVIVGGHFELRYTPRTGPTANWNNATTIIQKVAGNATSIDAFYQAGTWFLKTWDIVGLPSPDEAIVITTETDVTHQNFVRICEQETTPPWAGAKAGVVVEDHGGEPWLVLDYGAGGGLWDNQLEDIDDWLAPAVDILPLGGGDLPRNGMYSFYNNIDMGGVFTTRLALDLLSTPYFPGAATIDNRSGNVDSWTNWDDETTDLGGRVVIEMRSTQVNPASATEADWSQWTTFTAGDHTGWGFQFRAQFSAPEGENVAAIEMCIIADISNKVDENKGPLANGVPYVNGGVRVPFEINFKNVPAITVTIQNALVGEYVVITAKDRTGFNINLKTAAGAEVPAGRKFDWHAIGY